MAELVDLKLLRSKLSKMISGSNMRDSRLPSSFKNAFTEFGKYKIEEYYDYTLKISSQKSICIVPNQWVYIAASCCEYNRELNAYRDKLISIGITDEMFEACHPSSDNRSIPENEKTKDALEKKARAYLSSYNGNDKELLISFLWDYDSWGGGKNIKRGNDFAESPVLDIANSINASSSLIGTMAKALSDRADCLELLHKADEWNKFYSSSENAQSSSDSKSTNQNNPFLTAIRTKPFLLLAGISGTGKSRIVRKLAQATDDIDVFSKDEDRWKMHKPANFELIQVKPNWHNSMDVVGFKSNIGGEHYEFTPFVDFVLKAWQHEDTPFFLCLDEMNLAPVEEYFAEFLSAIENRAVNDEGEYETDPVIKPFDSFGPNCCGEMMRHIREDLKIDLPLVFENKLRQKGLTLPKNLIVMGTVNMDETTFSFSRKVLDRAMSIEMNKVNYTDFLVGKTEEDINCLTTINGLLVDRPTSAQQVKNDIDGEAVIRYLSKVNDLLDGTPFKLGYRAANEAMLYVAADKELGANDVKTALDDFTLMKILSRIEGDDEKLVTKQGNKMLDALVDLLRQEDMLGTVAGSKSLVKLNNMSRSLERDHFVSFWG